jgi:hypothetical protein
MVEPKICGSSLWNLFLVVLLVLRFLKWLLDLLKVCETLIYDNKTTDEEVTTQPHPALVLHPSYIPEKVGIN